MKCPDCGMEMVQMDEHHHYCPVCGETWQDCAVEELEPLGDMEL